ncbi:KH domain-containing protein [Lederbergia sp. NSJ-179]|uniref:KH domain-containing protein n=1 Tax=Lederbergia sp. NSJ-179 TaxID=2931402 RepID=UPI001FCFC8B1|nr:KH domain-containing protein [Lederbergia sp. NSJ-179]MCJ7839616.1 KH domain-containing protein [Lederbergia sp. NSJ-179]
MEKLILSIVKPIVDFPDDVQVEKKEEEHRIIYKLFTHENDIGKVIGKNGRVAKSIRAVIYAAAGLKQQKKVYLEID